MKSNGSVDPIDAFNLHWRAALRDSPLKSRSAICVSTIGADGFPDSRFVDLKVADQRGLAFCTSLESAKGRDIARNAKVGMAVWWDHVGIQVRFQGTCEPISSDEADLHWRSRSSDAQLATVCSRQGAPIDHPDRLAAVLESARQEFAGREIPRPDSWGGYRMVPTYVELLEFREDRLHVRTCHTRAPDGWRHGYLQP